MDTSETYIKMRLAAISDLGMGKPPESFGEDIITGEVTYNFQTENVFIDAKGNFYYSDETRACQLERQDQLQAASGLDWHDFDKRCSVYERVPAKEQAGIRVVMKELYNKVWGGEDWVKQ